MTYKQCIALMATILYAKGAGMTTACEEARMIFDEADVQTEKRYPEAASPTRRRFQEEE